MTIQKYENNEYWMRASNKLGGIYPYYNIEEKNAFTISFSEILAERHKNKLAIELDQTALVTKVCLLMYAEKNGQKYLVN